MDQTKIYQTLPLKELLTDFCGNPTPFKIITILNETDTVSNALRVFKNSKSKRKVIGIMTSKGTILHMGENELHGILANYLQKQPNSK